MTIQVSEKLHLRGEMLTMRSTPLRAYLDIVKPTVSYVSLNSACWRGYVGEWEICQERLYLLAIPAVSYTAQYQLEGSQLTVKRRLTIQREGRICKPADHEKWKEMVKLIRLNLRSQVLFQ